MTDQDLLRRYLDGNDQQAFADLVRRHSAWVYSCAKRLVRDGGLADDVTQAVFVLLARKSADLKGKTHLAGWLFRAAQYCAHEALRGKARREKHEREAAMQQQQQRSGTDWEEIWPVLDDAVAHLASRDRDAVLLRFYQGLTMREVAAAVGTGEEAAKKRVQRALEHLREILEQQGVTAGAGTLGVMMAERVTDAVEAKVVEGAIAAGAGAHSANAMVLVKGACQMMVWAKLKAAAVVLIGVGLIGGVGGVYSLAGSAERTPAASSPANPRALEEVVATRIHQRMPVTRDCMVLKYLPDWAHGEVDNIAVANNEGGVRTLLAFPEIAPEEVQRGDRRFLVALYSRETTLGRQPPGDLEVCLISSDWKERTSWATQPDSAEPALTVAFQNGVGWKLFDITALVRANAEAGAKSHGVMLRFAEESATSAPGQWSGYAFVSREGAAEWEAFRPVLVIADAAGAQRPAGQ